MRALKKYILRRNQRNLWSIEVLIQSIGAKLIFEYTSLHFCNWKLATMHLRSEILTISKNSNARLRHFLNMLDKNRAVQKTYLPKHFHTAQKEKKTLEFWPKLRVVTSRKPTKLILYCPRAQNGKFLVIQVAADLPWSGTEPSVAGSYATGVYQSFPLNKIFAWRLQSDWREVVSWNDGNEVLWTPGQTNWYMMSENVYFRCFSVS